MKDRTKHLKSSRVHERFPITDDVEVTFHADPIRGSGKNISAEGLFFIADEEIRVTVQVGGEEIEARLVRVENHGHGRTGIAVRFVDAGE